LLLGSSGAFAGSASAVSLSTGGIFLPWQWWYFLGTHFHPAPSLHLDLAHLFREAPPWIGSLGHTLPVAVMPVLTGLYAWLRRAARCRRDDALLLLALLLAARCVLDPWDISYYSLPFLVALGSWEAVSSRRLPVVSLMATFGVWFTTVAT